MARCALGLYFKLMVLADVSHSVVGKCICCFEGFLN